MRGDMRGVVQAVNESPPTATGAPPMFGCSRPRQVVRAQGRRLSSEPPTMLRDALDGFAARSSLHQSYDELIRVAVEICGAATAQVRFANEAEGLLTIFGT